MFEIFGMFWIFFGVLGFMIILSVFGSIISAFKKANTTTPPIKTTHYPVDEVVPEEPQFQTKTCSYCGNKIGVNESKCNSCGAGVKK